MEPLVLTVVDRTGLMVYAAEFRRDTPLGFVLRRATPSAGSGRTVTPQRSKVLRQRAFADRSDSRLACLSPVYSVRLNRQSMAGSNSPPYFQF